LLAFCGIQVLFFIHNSSYFDSLVFQNQQLNIAVNVRIN
jgi:hypothetical protein